MPSIINSDDGVVSGTSGLKTTGGNDGITTFQQNGTERMRIDSSGNVGIGTSSPATILNAYNATSAIISVDGDSTSSFRTTRYSTDASASAIISRKSRGTLASPTAVNTGDPAGQFVTAAYGGTNFRNLTQIAGFCETYTSDDNISGFLLFGTRPTGAGATVTERMRISAAGGLSVGTTADPGVGAIYATGNITAYYTSDRKFKTNIQDISNALGKVVAIGGKTFDWTDEYVNSRGGADGYFIQKSDFGVIAQDVQSAFPVAVRKKDDGTLAVDYEKLVALAFAAIAELKAEIDALKRG